MRLSRAIYVLAGVTLLFHIAIANRYGIFIDEMYYAACADHLGFGYVDHPPLVALITWLDRSLLGESLLALRLPSMLAGATTVLVVGLIARDLGGRRMAQLVAGAAVAFTPEHLFLQHILSMNGLDVLLWATAVWLFLGILRDDAAPRRWLALGVVVGIGLENKLSMMMCVFGLFVGMVLTPARRHLRTRWPWIALAIALVLFAPHVVWQVNHGFPTLEWMRNAALEKNRAVSPLGFLLGQVMGLTPVFALLAFLGLVFYYGPLGARFRALGWLYVAVVAVFALQGSKSYYAVAAYTPLMAGGAVLLERLCRRTWQRAVAAALIVGSAIAFGPFAAPVLPPETFIRYQRAIQGGPTASGERKAVGPLPQHFADMFGWEEGVALVAEVYRSLPEEERRRVVIYGSSYGHAGAIDFFGKRYGLPRAVSGHNSYWLWGPGDRPGDVAIVIGGDGESHRQAFEEVTLARIFHHPYAMPWRNHYPIWVCRRPKLPLAELWPRTKHYE